MFYVLISIGIGLLLGTAFKLLLPRYFASAVITILLGVIGAAVGGFGALLIKTSLAESAFLSAIAAIVFLVADGALAGRGNDADEIPETIHFTIPEPPPPLRELQVKTCPACRRTYADISLNFCLDDGAPLSSVMKIQTYGDPDETVSFSKRL